VSNGLNLKGKKNEGKNKVDEIKCQIVIGDKAWGRHNSHIYGKKKAVNKFVLRHHPALRPQLLRAMGLEGGGKTG